ncbi:hypothetical protein NE237_029507 [Protea cynaroides]|uniref:Cytochrome P450 n=1 Tax=Protea cynaroides TaxID=273540 RepID=A0A9Q0GUE2_9MAGN|nr:hypothetical protein NE237_029507 [Protea cynaroides]
MLIVEPSFPTGDQGFGHNSNIWLFAILVLELGIAGSGAKYCYDRFPSYIRTEEQEEKRKAILLAASGALEYAGRYNPSSPSVHLGKESMAESFSPRERAAERERVVLDIKVKLQRGQLCDTGDSTRSYYGITYGWDLIFASVDNPSNAIEWALAEMTNQPEMLQKVADEIDRVVGKARLVRESEIMQLNYVKACAREAFRLHPIAPINLPHVSSADTMVASYFTPKGSHVLLSRIVMGQNPKV